MMNINARLQKMEHRKMRNDSRISPSESERMFQELKRIVKSNEAKAERNGDVENHLRSILHLEKQN